MFFRRLSLLYLLLGVLIFTVVVFNVSILSSSKPTLKGKGATYFTSDKTTIQSHISNLDNEDYVRSLLKELETAKKEELLAEIRQKLEKEEKPRVIQELKTQLRTKYLDEIKKHIKDEVAEEHTNAIYRESAFSYDLFEKLVDEFAMEHKLYFEPAAFLQVLKDAEMTEEFKDMVITASSKYFGRQTYFEHLLKEILLDNKPKCEPLTKEEKGKKLNPTYQWDARVISQSYLRESSLSIPGEKFRAIRYAHDQVVEALKNLADPPLQFFKGHGIVINGGGNMIAAALTAIANLRERGSTLPVELVLDTKEEYDKQICEELLPKKLKGKCVIIEEEVGKDIFEAITEKFSRKILGLLVSSFDHTIAMDADNFAIKNVDTLLYTEPYLSNKMILWPDLWVKLTSPLYYKIARIEPGELVGRFGIPNDDSFAEYLAKDPELEVHFHDFANLPSPISVETGQIVFSKREHLRSLLLALYYNINSEDLYMNLIYQGAFGEGDRETITPALHVMNERYSLENQKVHLLGYTAENGKFSETTLGQTDPRDNVDFYADWKKFLKSRKLDTRLNPFQSGGYTSRLIEQFKEYKKKIIEDQKLEDEDTVHRVIDYKMPEILFLHCNHPKIDPVKNVDDGEYGIYSRRNMGPPESVRGLFQGIDWELRFHTVSKWVACEGITSSNYWDKVAGKSRAEVCKKVSEYVEYLKKDTFDPEATKLTVLGGKKAAEESTEDELENLKPVKAQAPPKPAPAVGPAAAGEAGAEDIDPEVQRDDA
ncbi:Alpha-1,2-mannosyltransferase MNN26 [Candida viswanathii]|uniref:Alpha-1,2-mannosyltransferase MNN26 n=1 Tax=Candida viswanathii TaxID=5486 RepID=A0A367YLF6_9ASCO|nr:Alpha-1,2-mannosyltransferase MNN26 [Candida viswanathii]